MARGSRGGSVRGRASDRVGGGGRDVGSGGGSREG